MTWIKEEKNDGSGEIIWIPKENVISITRRPGLPFRVGYKNLNGVGGYLAINMYDPKEVDRFKP